MTQQPATARGRRFLVTGAGGFIGARVVRRLVDLGLSVRAVDLQAVPRRISDLLDRVEYIQGDLAATRTVERVVDGVDRVLHLAAAGVGWGKDASFGRLLRSNVLATYNLITRAGRAGADRVVCAGSVFEYGYRSAEPGGAPLAAAAAARPLNLYGVTKAAATLLAPLAGDEAGVEVTTLRVFSPYGPGEDKGRFVPSTILAALRGEPIRMTAGEQVRDFCFVDDVASAFVLAADTRFGDHRVFNLGTGRALELREAVRLILEAVGVDVPVELGALPYRTDEAMTLVAETADLDDRLKGCLQTTFESGCARTVERYRSDGGGV